MMDSLSVRRIWLLPAVWRLSEQADQEGTEWNALELLKNLDAQAKADAVEVSEERRRLQNRRNQRAHRSRVRSKDTKTQRVQRPYKVRRWRFSGDDDTLSTAISSVASKHVLRTDDQQYVPQPLSHSLTEASKISKHSGSAQQSPSSALPSTNFPLSTDHLLHLIQYNVFRAFVSNKRTLNLLLTGWIRPSRPASTCPISGPYRDDTTVFPLNPNIPYSLSPTPLQQACIHSLYINFFPFPGVRDNLIRREGTFDQWELLGDLIGELLSLTPTQCQRRTALSVAEDTKAAQQQFSLSSSAGVIDDELTAGRRGLIVWGEPHDMRNWEATPGFIAKWSWAVEGCHDLVESSNYWRRLRGEHPLHMDVVKRHEILAQEGKK